MRFLTRAIVLAGILAGPASQGQAPGDLGIGSTRADIIAVYGEPRNELSAGTKEILTFANGRVILEDGKVTRMELPRPTPAPRPAGPTQAPPPPLAALAQPALRPAPIPREDWLTDYTAAQAEAAASKRRILALFTGSDWCPGCIQFEENVAHHPDFLATTRPAFVLLKLDYPRETPQPPGIRAQNEALRRRFGITAYPTLMIITADGATGSKVDTSPRRADDIVDFFVQAVDEARRKKPEVKRWWWPF